MSMCDSLVSPYADYRHSISHKAANYCFILSTSKVSRSICH